MKKSKANYRIVCVGASAGGMKAVREILSRLPKKFPLPIVIVQHLQKMQECSFVDFIAKEVSMVVKVAEDKEPLLPGHVYFAPPDYHLLVEDEGCFSLSSEEKVNFSRPSIDVLFESVADAYGSDAIGIILTGGNNDGAQGLRQIKEAGGLTAVQDPETAETTAMPMEAIKAVEVDHVLSLEKIAGLLKRVVKGEDVSGKKNSR